MTVYFVLGSVLVAWALIMTAVGLTRDGFPSGRSAGRGLIALSALLALAVLVTLLAVTEREHPREEAKAEAASEKRGEITESGEAEAGSTPSTGERNPAENRKPDEQGLRVGGKGGGKGKGSGKRKSGKGRNRGKGGGAAAADKGGGAAAGGGTVSVREGEFFIKLSSTEVEAGKIRFRVSNTGKVPHNFVVKTPGGVKKTPTFGGGKTAKLEVDLKPGKYEVFCSVPGHEPAGMKAQLSVK